LCCGAQHGRGGGRAARGGNLRCNIKIDLKEAAFGCDRSIEIRRNELCAKCDGSGAKPGSRPEKCPYCAGRGQIVQAQGFFRVQTTCPACHGEGEIVRDKCGHCSGSGREVKSVKLEVKVPAGVDNGMQLCLRGEGDPGHKGGPRGDLFCDVHVAEHPLFKRHEQDLVCAVPISYSQAALGTSLEIPSLEGREQLVIAAGSQPGDVIRLRGKGMPDPHSRRKGDLLVQLVLEVPRNLTPRQEELLREMAELEKKNVSPHQKSFFEKIKDLFGAAEKEESAKVDEK
jgi:molecular chaperone DnaJ